MALRGAKSEGRKTVEQDAHSYPNKADQKGKMIGLFWIGIAHTGKGLDDPSRKGHKKGPSRHAKKIDPSRCRSRDHHGKELFDLSEDEHSEGIEKPEKESDWRPPWLLISTEGCRM
jgi:hypothetical protein